MKAYSAIALATLAGFVAGTGVTQTLTAQVKAPVYQISEIEITDATGYSAEYAPKSRAALTAAGGKTLAAGSKLTTIDGEPPRGRVAVVQWDSIEQAMAYVNSATYKELKPIRDKHAKFRTFTIEGL